ncbi:CRISPR-associated endonuclease Cas2 [Thermincola ferriacetica]
MKKNIIIFYDIPNDRRRTKLAKKLQDYLDRIQFSVFAGKITLEQQEEIAEIIAKVINDEEDSVIMLEVCAKCMGKLKEQGTAKMYTEEGPIII